MFLGDKTLMEHLPEEDLRQTVDVLALELCSRRLDDVFNLANVDKTEASASTVSAHMHLSKRKCCFLLT